MLENSEANVKEFTNALFAKHFAWAIFLIVPLSLASCVGGGIAGGILITGFNGVLIKVLGGMLVFLGLTSVFWIQPMFKKLFRPSAKRLLNKFVDFEESAARRVVQLAGNNCYFNAVAATYGGGAMSADPVTRKIYAVTGGFDQSGKIEFKEITLSPSDISTYAAIEGGFNTTQLNPHAPVSRTLMNHRDNLVAAAAHSRTTGLKLNTKLLHDPVIFINFDAETARRWVLVIDKLIEGTLESPKTPTIYP